MFKLHFKLFQLFFIAAILSACNGNSPASDTQQTIAADSAQAEMPVIPDLIVGNFVVNYKGTINNKLAISLELIKFEHTIAGSYHYDGKNISLRLSGGMEDTGELRFNETTEEGDVTGCFEGVMRNDSITGTWYNAKRTKSMPFVLVQQSIASLQSKSDVLSDAIGTYSFSYLAGGMGANSMFDTYNQKGKWHCSSSGIVSSMRESTDIDLSDADINLLNNLHIVVDDNRNVHVYAGLVELVNCPYNQTKMDDRIKKTDGTELNEKLSTLSANTIFNENHLILLADNHIDFSNILKGNFDIIATDNLILSYNFLNREFELEIFESTCCNSNILYFRKK